MSNYSPVTNFLSKDSLVSGNPLKALKGAELSTEFTAVQIAVNSKLDSGAITVSGAGNVNIATPTSGDTVTVNNFAGANAFTVNYTQAAGVGWVLSATSAPTDPNADVRGFLVQNTAPGSTHGTFGYLVGNDTINTFGIGKNSTGSTGRFAGAPAGDLSWMQSGGNVPIAVVVGSPATVQMLISPTTTTIRGALGINGASPPAQVTGWGTPTGASVANNFNGAAATLPQATAAIAELITVLKAFGLLGT